MKTIDERIEKTENCWNWTGTLSGSGYGRAQLNGKTFSVHRYTYEREYGKIPEGLEIDHLCRNRKCVNPKHLEAVTHRENVLRGYRAVLTNFCPKGHPYNEKNLYWIKSGEKQWRGCRVCRKYNMRDFKMVKRAMRILFPKELQTS